MRQLGFTSLDLAALVWFFAAAAVQHGLRAGRGRAPGSAARGGRGAVIDRAWRVSHYAAEHFNYGLRAYYFALAALAWLLNGWLFMGSTAWVVFVLYWRELRSAALASIKQS
ncbi:MAG TPA: DUF599 family protein [Burkholderiales bacterium]|nr:DUF599 family protein [Burkholderiales bacterium]